MAKKAILVDEEFLELLERLRKKINSHTWDGLKNISYADLTRILARKINTTKII